MYKKAGLVITVIILVGHLTSCSSDKLPNKGGFIKQGSTWVELKQFNGGPDSFSVPGIPQIADRRPVISLWMETEGQGVEFHKMASPSRGERTIVLDETPLKDGVVQYRPTEDLVAGIYCAIWIPPSVNDFNQFFCFIEQ
jgi:hypothetical protein